MDEIKTDEQKQADGEVAYPSNELKLKEDAPKTHPLRVRALELAWAIEELPASEKQAEASQKATELQLAVQNFLDKYGTTQSEERPERMLRWFEYSHLPKHLQEVSKPCGDLAVHLCKTVQGGPERTVALRKLLEAKDAAVRAKLNPGG